MGQNNVISMKMGANWIKNQGEKWHKILKNC